VQLPLPDIPFLTLSVILLLKEDIIYIIFSFPNALGDASFFTLLFWPS